jgi:hypothetical protein
MGNGIYYGLNGKETYYCDGTIVSDSKGLSGKVILEMGDTDYHSGLPVWSKKSLIYFKKDDSRSHQIEQMRVFSNRRVALDFDWNHKHKRYAMGIVHVHEWHFDSNGKWVRSVSPRYMNDEEMKTYGEIIKNANPNVKFRP